MRVGAQQDTAPDSPRAQVCARPATISTNGSGASTSTGKLEASAHPVPSWRSSPCPPHRAVPGVEDARVEVAGRDRADTRELEVARGRGRADLRPVAELARVVVRPAGDAAPAAERARVVGAGGQPLDVVEGAGADGVIDRLRRFALAPVAELAPQARAPAHDLAAAAQGGFAVFATIEADLRSAMGARPFDRLCVLLRQLEDAAADL